MADRTTPPCPCLDGCWTCEPLLYCSVHGAPRTECPRVPCRCGDGSCVLCDDLGMVPADCEAIEDERAERRPDARALAAADATYSAGAF